MHEMSGGGHSGEQIPPIESPVRRVSHEITATLHQDGDPQPFLDALHNLRIETPSEAIEAHEVTLGTAQRLVEEAIDLLWQAQASSHPQSTVDSVARHLQTAEDMASADLYRFWLNLPDERKDGARFLIDGVKAFADNAKRVVQARAWPLDKDRHAAHFSSQRNNDMPTEDRIQASALFAQAFTLDEHTTHAADAAVEALGNLGEDLDELDLCTIYALMGIARRFHTNEAVRDFMAERQPMYQQLLSTEGKDAKALFQESFILNPGEFLKPLRQKE